MKSRRDNKLSLPFQPDPLLVAEQKGNKIVAESDQGVWYKRNFGFFMPYISRELAPGLPKPPRRSPVDVEPAQLEPDHTINLPESSNQRPISDSPQQQTVAEPSPLGVSGTPPKGE